MKDNFLIRRAVIEDAEEIYNIMVQVAEALEDKTLFVCDDLEYVKEQIEQSGFAVVSCKDDGEIVGSFIFRYPDSADDNLGRDVNLPDNKLEQVVHMESVVVLPEHRGNHLQERMLHFGEKLIDSNRYHFLMATVSPENPASYLNFEKNGYILMMTKEKYGGLMRRIYQKII